MNLDKVLKYGGTLFLSANVESMKADNALKGNSVPQRWEAMERYSQS